jgi:hypothetical protein
MRCPFEGQVWLNAEGQHLIFNDLYCREFLDEAKNKKSSISGCGSRNPLFAGY